MNAPLILIGSVVALGLIYGVLPVMVHTFHRFRNRKVITCPETRAPAEVKLDAGRAAVTSAFRKPLLRVADCSLWPGKKGCAEDCVEAHWPSK